VALVSVIVVVAVVVVAVVVVAVVVVAVVVVFFRGQFLVVVVSLWNLEIYLWFLKSLICIF